MKLDKIINYRTKSLTSKNLSDRKDSPIGSGLHSNVYSHDTDPHLVTKVSDSQYDGFKQYTKFIKNKMDSNPFFPRIYSHKNIKNGDIEQNIYDIEKLVPIEKISKSNQDAMLNGLLDFKLLRNIIEKLPRQERNDFWDYEYFLSDQNITYDMSLFMSLLYAYVGGAPSANKNINNIIINKQLLDAFHLLKRTGSRDIHTNNIMGRLTKYGYQLVFSDPR